MEDDAPRPPDGAPPLAGAHYAETEGSVEAVRRAPDDAGAAPGQLAAAPSGWAARPPAPPRRSRPGGRALALLLAAVVVFGGGMLVGRAGAPAAAGNTPTPGASTGAVATPAGTSPTPLPSGVPIPDFGLAKEAWNLLYANYVDVGSLDPTTLEQGAVRGLVEAVGDTGHTGYLTPEQVKARDEELSGTFVGIGVTVDDQGGYTTIVRVLPNSPAERAGLRPGDRIVAVGGTSTKGLTVDDVVTDVRGPEGTPVTITLRAPDGSERTLTLVRAKLDLPLVSWALIPGTTYAAIRLESFSSGAGDAVASALREARAAGATAILFDLRGNPGGYVDQAVTVASQFLSSGNVYLTRDRSGKETPSPVTPGGIAPDLPLVVLVDGQTASAAEIVVGALQDAGRARLVGERTFGTGTVLGTFPLSDGSAIAIGTQRWLTPKGRAIWKEGITPDVAAALPTGASLLLPDDLATLGAAGIATSTDSQFTAGLSALRALAGD